MIIIYILRMNGTIMNHYETLNVKQTATENEIKASFRKLATKYHPDKNGGNKTSEEKFKQINEAYQILSDKEERAKYDQFLSMKANGFGSHQFNRNSGSQSQSTHNFDEQDIQDMFANFFNSRNGFNKTNNKQDNHEGFFSKFYDTHSFGEKSLQQVNLNITFWEAALGATKTIILPEEVIKGQVKTTINIKPATEEGTVYLVKVKNVEFELHLKIKPHTNDGFSRDGLNLTKSIDVPFTTALLGGTIVFPHWTKDMEVTIPAFTKNGQKMRLKDLGIQRNNEKGHLFLQINITMPEKLTKKQKDLLEEFQKIENTKKRK